MTSRSLASIAAVAAFVSLFAAVSPGQAQVCTLTAGGATYGYPATSHYDNSQTSNFTGVGTGDYLFEDGWWFRVSGDTAESFFPAPSTTTCAGAAGTITWADVNARGLFSASHALTLTSAAAGSGEVIQTMTITNLSASNPLTIELFHGADFDVNGSAGTDNATLGTRTRSSRSTTRLPARPSTARSTRSRMPFWCGPSPPPPTFSASLGMRR